MSDEAWVPDFGTVVRLKSGGVNMTVVDIVEKGPNEPIDPFVGPVGVLCVWHRPDGGPEQHVFAVAALEPVNEASQ